MGQSRPIGGVRTVSASPRLCCKTQKRGGEKISQFVRRNGFSAIRCLPTSLQRQPVGNQTVHVTPYIVFERTHQRPLEKFARTPKKSFATQSPRSRPSQCRQQTPLPANNGHPLLRATSI